MAGPWGARRYGMGKAREVVMAEKKFYSINEAAEILGVTPAEVNRMRERNELRGYRDGPDWKFKVEQVQQKLAERIRQQKAGEAEQAAEESSSEDVLLSEPELGEPVAGGSGTVIEPGAGSPADSDIQLAGEGEAAAEEEQPAPVGMDLAGEQTVAEDDSKSVDEVELTAEEDVALEDSEVTLGVEPAPANGSDAGTVDLTSDEALEDEELVLGGSGSGSDVTIGDSGISLVDPADSGLSLEEPLDLGAAEESLEVGEEDMLTLSGSEEGGSEVAELEVDSDFELTPLEEGEEEEDSESGSQVIALDESDTGETPTLGAEAAAPALLEEEFAPTAGLEVAPEAPAAESAPLAQQPPAVAPGVPPVAEPSTVTTTTAAALPEAPYTVWNIVSLGAAVVLLGLIGMMSFDLLLHMWSWESPNPISSSLMEFILGLFG